MASEDRLPTEEEIAQLPRWARVAFAVRCAERMWPILNRHDFDTKPEMRRAVLETLEYSKRAARSKGEVDLQQLNDATTIVGNMISGYPLLASIHSVLTAVVAAAAAVDPGSPWASDTWSTPGTWDRKFNSFIGGTDSLGAARAAINAAILYDNEHHASENTENVTKSAIRRDIEAIRAMVEREKWTDNTPVDPDSLGPLWPDGEPEGWPEIPPPPFKLTIDPGDATTEEVQELLAAISELHEVHTGYALTYRTDGTLIRADEEVRV